MLSKNKPRHLCDPLAWRGRPNRLLTESGPVAIAAGGKPSALDTSQADLNVRIAAHHYDFKDLFDQSGASQTVDQSYRHSTPPPPLSCDLTPGISCGGGVGAVWGNGGNQR